MFRPKLPTMPQPSGSVARPAAIEPTTIAPGDAVSASVPSSAVTPVPASNHPTIQLTPGTALALVGGGTAVVLVVGAVLVSLLLAVAITGASVAVCAVVIRSLVNADAKRR
ncbi:SpdD-like protein [Streptomyces sp. NPDC006458]|uniref:SpdD-like protein n=1 Tax=Streptomyces sp. NPDC006458 TaxID=3154302 RepID=UPI0033B3F46E